MVLKFIASQFKRPNGLFGIFSSNMMIKSNQKNYDKLIKDLDVQSHDKLLEIGYGPGIGLEMIAKLCPSCTIDGIDFSKLMYKRASKYNRPYIENGRVQLMYGDFLTTSLPENNYDKVFCLNVIYFWDELNTPFAKIFALLKKGGAFHIYMADRDSLLKKKAPDSVFNKYFVEQVSETLKAVGFDYVEHYLEKGLYIKAKK